MLNDNAIRRLIDRARREVDAGLLASAQVALAYEGKIVAEETFVDATLETRFCIFSATQPFVAGAVWE